MGDEVIERQSLSTIEEEAQQEVKKPSMYKVFILNDDFTPMDFVVEVLESFFSMPRERAVTLMLQVHQTGKAICGVFTRDIAETKVVQVNEYAQCNEHPLLCGMEAE